MGRETKFFLPMTYACPIPRADMGMDALHTERRQPHMAAES